MLAVVVSWFEERPFCLHLTRPRVTASRPPKTALGAAGAASATAAASAFAPAAAAAPRAAEGVLAAALRDPRRLRAAVTLARLLKLVVTDPQAEETLAGSGLVRTVVARRVAV